ncbi:MAG: restriction endonuclease subunit S [Bacteroidetes bacterium]|nr:restriction endonuclease subunit S [Bacteroidota bacterium]
MELRPGYKKTEVGVIPEDWEVRTLGSIIDFQGGAQPPLTTFIPVGKEGYIRLLQIRDYKTNKYKTYIPINRARKFCNREDIMIGRYGPPIFQILRGLEGAYNVALMKAIPTKQVTKDYAFHLLKQDSLFNFVEKLSQRSSGQTGVDLQQLKLYPIGLPSITEQTAIATALSNADVLIFSLEKLIDKKCNIKQGAMQKLLKPKEGWEVKKLSEVLKVKHGKSQKEVEDKSGKYPILGTGGLMSYTNQFLYEKPSVLIGRKGTIDKPQYLETPFWTVDTLFYTEIFEGYCAKFIFYLFNLIDWYSYNEASGVPSLNAKTIEKIEKGFPTYSEQTRIANILSDMDAEIAALEGKLEKYRKIKQGMMQNLLTGKIRLIS